MPRLLRLDPPRHVLYLEELPGEPLNVALDRLDLTEAMEQLGTLHRAVHELDVRNLPQRRTTADWLQDARQAATQIGLFVPAAAREAEAVYAGLERTAPEDGRLLFCQGDFLPGQILCDPSGWSVIDFDDSRYADPLSEVAALYAALPRELGLPPDLRGAGAAYLPGGVRAAVRRADRPGPLALVPGAGPARRPRQATHQGTRRPGDAESLLRAARRTAGERPRLIAGQARGSSDVTSA